MISVTEMQTNVLSISSVDLVWNLYEVCFGNFKVSKLRKEMALSRTTDKRTDVWSRDFIKWKINFGLWAVTWAGQWEKRVWADYEQLLRPVFSLFRGQKNILNFF